MTLDEAINIARGIDKCRAEPRPTVQEALEQIEEQLATCGFNWLTGQEAQRVLQEACTQSTHPKQEKQMAKTTLTVEVEYNDRVTDPEAIASAADRLMETVLSTPGIMEEYGDPRFGEFLVLSPKAKCVPDFRKLGNSPSFVHRIDLSFPNSNRSHRAMISNQEQCMNASKENAAKALAELDKKQPDFGFIRTFLEAAQRKLPKEASYKRERAAKAQKPRLRQR